MPSLTYELPVFAIDFLNDVRRRRHELRIVETLRNDLTGSVVFVSFQLLFEVLDVGGDRPPSVGLNQHSENVIATPNAQAVKGMQPFGEHVFLPEFANGDVCV
jgi:hypothetical protein